jgi:hypothetical protein
VRSLVIIGLSTALAGLALAAPAGADQTGITREMHPWARFQPGAWKLVRVVTENLDDKGNVTGTSTTETKTTLRAVESGGVTLLVESVMEMAGKRLDAEPKTVKQGFYSQTGSENVTIKSLGAGHVAVGGKTIFCNIEQAEVDGPAAKTITKTYYSTTVVPYILKLETVSTDLEGKVTLNETNVDVLDLNVLSRVLRQVRRSAHMKVVSKHGKGSSTTLATTAPEIPGGIVSEAAKEFDDKGHLLRRTNLELVDFGLDPSQDHTGLFGRSHRTHQRHRHSSY